LTLLIVLLHQSIVMQNAIVINITLSMMKYEINLMFDEDAFTLPESFEAEEIDIFAELGVKNLNQNSIINNKLVENEQLAILMSELEEETSAPALTEEFVSQPLEQSISSISDETISELLEILVKEELKSMDEQDIISTIPAKVKLDAASAKVRKNNDEFEISVILEVDGSEPVRPFAKVRSENNMLQIDPAPSTIPNSWIPLYNALRDMLAKAMQSLSSTQFTIDKNF